MPRTKEAFEAMRENTRNKIETSALSLFARQGLAVKVEEIAREAGVSKGLLYSHYPSKEALILELIRQATSTSSNTIQAFADAEGEAAEKIRDITAMMCMMFTATIGIEYFMFMLQVGMSGMEPPEDAYYTDGMPNPVGTFAQIIAQGQAEGTVKPGDPLRLSILYWATIQGLCAYAITGMPIVAEPQLIERLLIKE